MTGWKACPTQPIQINNKRGYSRSAQRGEIHEKVRIGFGNAAWTLDPYARRFQTHDRKAHRYSMIIVGLNRRRGGAGRLDLQPVFMLDHLHTQARQLHRERVDAVAFMMTDEG